MLDQIRHGACLRLRCFQKLASDGDVVEQVPHDDRGSVRGTDFGDLKRRHILGLRLVRKAGHHVIDGADADEGVPCLGDHFHFGDRCNGRQRLPAEAQAVQARKVLRLRDLARCVAAEGLRDLRGLNAASVVRHADEVDASVFDLHRDGSGSGVDGILRELLDHVDGPLHDLSGRDAVDGVRTQYMNFCHCHYFPVASQRFFSSDCSR